MLSIYTQSQSVAVYSVHKSLPTIGLNRTEPTWTSRCLPKEMESKNVSDRELLYQLVQCGLACTELTGRLFSSARRWGYRTHVQRRRRRRTDGVLTEENLLDFPSPYGMEQTTRCAACVGRLAGNRRLEGLFCLAFLCACPKTDYARRNDKMDQTADQRNTTMTATTTTERVLMRLQNNLLKLDAGVSEDLVEVGVGELYCGGCWINKTRATINDVSFYELWSWGYWTLAGLEIVKLK